MRPQPQKSGKYKYWHKDVEVYEKDMGFNKPQKETWFFDTSHSNIPICKCPSWFPENTKLNTLSQTVKISSKKIILIEKNT